MHRCRPLALLCGTWLVLGAGAQAADGLDGIEVAANALELAWKRDPRTSGITFPLITSIKEASQLQRDCPRAWPMAPQALAHYCPEQRRVLFDRPRLEALATQFGSWDASVWLAAALGQALVTGNGQPSGQLESVATNLQAYCFGGTLLGQAQGLSPPANRSPLAAAFTAFPARLIGQQGTPAQRAYALLTGLGGTASDCGATAIANLAAGVVPDPERLKALAANPDRSTGGGAIGDVIDALCLPRAPLGCPRRLPQARVRSTP